MRPTDEQLRRINALVLEGNYSADEVEVFRSYLADLNVVQGYYYQFVPETLKAFQAELRAGDVALSILHASDSVLPIGRSFNGYFDPIDNILYGDFFIPVGKEVAGTGGSVSTDSIIEGIKSGMFSDTSIEFDVAIEDKKCSICGNMYFSSACSHYAGYYYPVEGSENGETKMCVVLLENKKGMATLGANSIVGDGAVKEAGFVSFPTSPEYIEGVQQTIAACNPTVSLTNTSASDTAWYLYSDNKVTPWRIFSPSDNSVDFLAYKPAIRFGFGNIFDKGGVGMLQFTKEEFQKTVDELAEKKAELKTLSSDMESLKSENSELSSKVEELNASLTSVKEALASLNGLKDSVVELAYEFGVKAFGKDYKSKEDLGSCSTEELMSELKANVEKFMAEFPVGQQSPKGGTDSKYDFSLDPLTFKSN